MTSTAVRVALRVRPLTQKEQLANCTECLSYIPNEPQILIGTDKSFTYDHVFDTNTHQDTVYSVAAGPLVQKFMDGFNATILAYGQTGSGKTYSMGTGLENSGDPENEGIVPRCIYELFEKLDQQAQEQEGFSYEVAVSFLELYNEELIDLLNPSTAQKRKSLNGTVTHTTEVSIREDIAGNIYWSGVREEPCHSPEELLGFLAKGSLCRTTGSTEMNAVSSRSHAIFSVILRQHQPDQEQSTSLTSKFHFVDLAGSERLKRTNAQGDRAREGIAINSGLLALGNVISALGDEARRTTHIPYRDSKLTRLLQDSLGGNSQTMMLACVSPADTNFMETLNTLKYANRARNIKNRVTINQDFAGSSIEVNQLKALVGRLRMEIAALRAEGGNGGGSSSSNNNNMAHEDQIRALKSEIGRLRERIDDMSANIIQVSSERDTLLMERELDEFINDGGDHDDNNSNRPAITQHPIIAQYQKKIQDLTNELADTRDQLAFATSVKPTSTNMLSRPRAEPSLSTGQRRRRQHRRKRGGRMSASSSSTTTAIRPSRAASRQAAKKKKQSTIVYSDIEEDEGFVNDEQEGDIRKEVKDSIAKARDEIRKGMEVLELIKPLDDTAKAWEAELQAFEDEERRIHQDRTLTDEGTFSSTPSPIGMEKHYRTEEDDFMDEIEELAVPTWEDAEKPKQQTCDAKSVSTMDQSVDSGSTMVHHINNEKPNPQMVRMLHQIQSDIKVKEELVSHLEKSENEYIFMRRKFDDKIAQLQTQLVELQRERDEALDRTKSRLRSKSDASVQQKEKQQLIDIRHAYEAKTKHLLTEIQDLRRKYSQMTSTMQATRNQNETLLRSLRANVDTLQVEKKRMIKRMRMEADRVREQMSTQERRIHQLQRQQAEANMAKRRLEREHENQKQILKKRNEEILINHNQLKQMTNVLKKAVREGGILDERLLSKVSHIVGGSFAIVARGRGLGFGRRPRSNKRINPIPVQERAARKKELLDKALSQFIQGKQAIVEMEQLLVRRERLANEKLELLEERKHIYLAEKENAETTGQPMDMMAVELMDERVDLMSAEISYLSARIRALQSEAAGESMEDEAHAVTTTAARIEKHVTFADEIITDPAPTDEWADMDAFEEQFSVPSNAAPELAYDMTVKLLKSLEADECKRIAESLVDDIMTLRMSECNHQVTQQNLEKSVMDLRRTLIVMKRAAIATTIENERRIRKLEEKSALHHQDDEEEDVQENRSRSPTDEKIEEYINGGNTIFDKIYEDGLRGLIATPEPGADIPTMVTPASPRGFDMSRTPTGSPRHHDEDFGHCLSPSLAATANAAAAGKPPQPLKDQDRDITPSPDRFYNMIQKRLSWQQRQGGSESPVPITMISPAEFARYAADQDSSTSSIHSSHLRRSSLPSDYSSSQSQQSWNQHPSNGVVNQVPDVRKPRQRLSLRELSTHGGGGNVDAIPNISNNAAAAEYDPPLPPSSPLANYSSTVTTSKQYKRRTMPAVLPTEQRPSTPVTGNVFDRLSQTPTRASRAKMTRHSSGSVEDLRLRWDSFEHQERSSSPFY